MGVVIAYTGAHPILVSLSMMIFLRGLGEFLTRGGDISGFPTFVAAWVRARFSAFRSRFSSSRMRRRVEHPPPADPSRLLDPHVGSNTRAARYSGVDTRRASCSSTLSGVMSAIAGIVMLARFNSVRVGHGEAYLLVTVLASFLGRVDPFGGFGRIVSV